MIRAVYDKVLTTALPSSINNGLPRCVGSGMHWLKQAFGISALGVYCSSTAQVAFNRPLGRGFGGPQGRNRTEFSLVVEDGPGSSVTVIRCIAYEPGLIYK